MSHLAPTLEAFFTERLVNQRHASANTVAAYRDAWRLVLRYAQNRTGKQPCQLDLTDLDATFIGGFLDHLEQERGNSVRTRNARLAAIRSFFRYAALRHPEHAQLIARVLAIPTKRGNRTELAYLDQPEVDALLAAPDRRTWTGRRDHALLDTRSRHRPARLGADRAAQQRRRARHRRTHSTAPARDGNGDAPRSDRPRPSSTSG